MCIRDRNRATACNWFFKIDGKLWKKHLLNQISGKGYDVSIDIQRQCSQIILDDIDKIKMCIRDRERLCARLPVMSLH